MNIDRNPQDFLYPEPKAPQAYHNFLKFIYQAIQARARVIDRSSNNNDDDLIKLKANSDVVAIVHRATMGISGLDTKFQERWPKYLENDFFVSPYHLFIDSYGGSDQANNFLAQTINLREQGMGRVFVPWMDVERNDGASISQRQNRLYGLLWSVENEWTKPGFYSSPSLWNTLIGTVTSWNVNDFYQWVAHWTSASSPTLPLNWTNEQLILWQYGIYPTYSWVEQVIGANGAIDVNWLMISIERLRELCEDMNLYLCIT